MALPDETAVREWCRIDDGQFDDVLPMMISGATNMASHITGRNYLNEVMPDNVQMWCAAVVSHWLSNPDAQAKNEIAPFLDRMLDSERKYL